MHSLVHVNNIQRNTKNREYTVKKGEKYSIVDMYQTQVSRPQEQLT